jgi:hypothetical protein
MKGGESGVGEGRVSPTPQIPQVSLVHYPIEITVRDDRVVEIQLSNLSLIRSMLLKDQNII